MTAAVVALLVVLALLVAWGLRRPKPVEIEEEKEDPDDYGG